MHKKDFRKTEAYFTVEASMIMPLVIVLIGMFFYLTFFLYNRCAISQDAYILAFRGSLYCGKEEGEVKQEVMADGFEKLKKKYINASYISCETDVNKRTVTVETKGCLAATGWDFGAKWQAQRICPVDCIRKVRLAQKIKEDLENKLDMDLK